MFLLLFYENVRRVVLIGEKEKEGVNRKLFTLNPFVRILAP